MFFRTHLSFASPQMSSEPKTLDLDVTDAWLAHYMTKSSLAFVGAATIAF